MRLLAVLLYAGVMAAQPADDKSIDAAAIMAKVADRMEKSADFRKQYVYHQRIRSSLIRTNGQAARHETREYSVFPTEKARRKNSFPSAVSIARESRWSLTRSQRSTTKTTAWTPN